MLSFNVQENNNLTVVISLIFVSCGTIVFCDYETRKLCKRSCKLGGAPTVQTDAMAMGRQSAGHIVANITTISADVVQALQVALHRSARVS